MRKMKKTLKKLKRYPFHMPGHKRNMRLIKNKAFKLDFTEIDGSDNLHSPAGIIKNTMDFAAKLYGTKKTFLLVNGSTCGLLSAISACTNLGDKILIARNCHKSVYNCVFLRNLTPLYVYPPQIKWGINGGISPADVENILKTNKIKAFVMVSPTYEGVVSDVKKIGEICHKYGCMLIVDQAHGAHFGFSADFPKSAVNLGADIVIESLHKTLPALTQTALLHICTNAALNINIEKYLSIYETSSPSYILMESIDACIRFMASKKGHRAVNEYVKNLKNCRKKLHCYILNDNIRGTGNVYDYDISKIVLCGGKSLFEELKKYNIECEMCSNSYTIALTSIGDSKKAFASLQTAVRKINKKSSVNSPNTAFMPKSVLTPYNAVKMPCASVPLSKSINKISASTCYIYPPGIPVIVPGEIITQSAADIINEYIKNGFEVNGLNEDKTINVIIT